MTTNPFPMKKIILLICLSFAIKLTAQDTFSICAVDTVTGEVGSAGASCLDAHNIAGGAFIISDVHPGVGVIHTQAQWDPQNQYNGQAYMNARYAPKKILDSLLGHDAGNDTTIRQYGIVDLFQNKARVAAFTGSKCMDYKNHIIGKNYSIQGNILKGQGILDSIEARFNRMQGPLACKLMAALTGARVIGADTRCAPSGSSSLSSFLVVAQPGDTTNGPSLSLVVPRGPKGYEPLDSLLKLYNKHGNTCGLVVPPPYPTSDIAKLDAHPKLSVYPNPSEGDITLLLENTNSRGKAAVYIYNSLGTIVKEVMLNYNEGVVLSRKDFLPGMYFYRLAATEQGAGSGKLIFY